MNNELISQNIIFQNTKLPKIAIIGAGSIGKLFFHLIKQRKILYPFFVDTRLPNNKKISSSFIFKGLHNEEFIEKYQMLSSPAIKNADYILITTKAWQAENATEKIKKYIKRKVPVIVMTNGYGAQNEVANILNMPVAAGTTSMGAMKIKNCIIHTGWGNTYIGPYTNSRYCHQVHNILTLFTICHAVNAEFSFNINEKIMSKLAVNSIINPLTALYQIPNGALLQRQNEWLSLFNEIFPILKAMGLTTSKEQTKNDIVQVITRTSHNKSSMAADFAYNRKSELDYILGVILQEAAKMHITPNIASHLYDTLKKLETRNINL